MRIFIAFLLTFTALLGFSTSSVFAQGKGKGLGKSLGSLGQAASNAQAAQATQGLSHAGNATSQINRGLGSSAGGMQRASSALKRAPEFRMPSNASEGFSKNAQRILDHRMGQAQHLRDIAARNGNEHLLETADRMDASAIRNYERQTGTTLDPEATPDLNSDSTPELNTDSTPELEPQASPEQDSELTPIPAYVVPAEMPRRPSRGFWFRSR